MTTNHLDISIGHTDVARAYADDNGGIVVVTADDTYVRIDEVVLDAIVTVANRRAA